MIYIDMTIQIRDNGNGSVDVDCFFGILNGNANVGERRRTFVEVKMSDGLGMAQAARARYLAYYRKLYNEPNDSDEQLELPF